MLDNNVCKKIMKNDTRSDFEGVNLISFSVKDMASYYLKPLENFIKEELFFKYLERVDADKEYFTYYRGDDMKKYSYGTAQSVKDYGLGKFFIVGEKGLGYFNNNFCKKSKEEREEQDLEELIEKIEKKYPKFDRSKLPLENKRRIVKAIIHNAGKEKFEEKADSPFISVAVGDDNLDVATIFAKESAKDTFIMMGVEKVSNDIINSQYLAQFLTQDLEIIEEEQEILINNVLWPFSIVGVFTFIDGKKEFIVNPWLVEAIKYNTFDQKYYFNVNQEKFDKFYKELGYKNYIVRYSSIVDSYVDIISST